jgi:hypothetical protein
MLYPRLIEIRRPKTVAAQPGSDVVGLTGYSGMEPTTAPANPQGEVVIVKNIPASIQASTIGGKQQRALPTDVSSAPQWTIYVALAALPKGTLRDRDIIVDDESYRYEVASAYWNVLGWKIPCIRLNV